MAHKKSTKVEGQLDFAFGVSEAAVAVMEQKAQHPKKPAGSVKKETAKPAVKKEPEDEDSKNEPKESAPRSRRKTQQIADDQIEAKAKDMARHLLGFDNPRKALLTAIKEAVDNSLDACEEAQILPDIEVGIKQTGEDRFCVWVQDNGPGIVKSQIPNIFGRLLYGSKFHTLRMARGQQGIGISAAGMYGLLTTGKSVKIDSKTGPKSQANHYELQINTKKNRPEVIVEAPVDWPVRSGTRVEIELQARYQKGRQSVDEYLMQTAITNPHAQIRYLMPDGQERFFARSVQEVVEVPKAVKPHPYGVELGILLKMAKDSQHKTMASFLQEEFSRISERVSQEILKKAKLSARQNPHTLTHAEAEKLYQTINETKIMAPSTSCVVPIGQAELLKGLQQVVTADFYTSCTRPPAVYRGNPFQIEVALAYGGTGVGDTDDEDSDTAKNGSPNGEQELMRVLRFANRVPLLYQQSACAIFKSIMQTNWRLYGLSQSRGALPAGPVTVIVHIASVWVPFTSESKEAVAHYPEIIKEIKLAISDCGRGLGRFLRGVKRQRDEALKRSYITKYLPAIGEALKDILTLKDSQVQSVLSNLEVVLEQSRSKS
ncbi:MAG: DNA topoisomerase VI subunit B [Planctomycetes bacterium ADurb.Bin412]|nr:MAG: DNA topoisomerase VI subunit B [Planctomycetes bacterium ADurb.Bin412]